MEDKDRVIALGTVAILAGTIAIFFTTRTGTVWSVLMWIFAGLAIAGFIALTWSWYLRSLSWLQSHVIARRVPRHLSQQSIRAPLAVPARWRFTTDGAAVPQVRRDFERNIDHPSYVRPADSAPPCMRVIALVACSPLEDAPSSQELRGRFLTWLAQAPAMTLVSDVRTIPQGVSWKSWATARRSSLRADLTGENQARVPVASAVLELPSASPRLAGTDPGYAELILHVDLPASDFAAGLPDWRRRFTQALAVPGELARFLQDLGLAVPGGPPAQAGVLLRARQAITEIVSPGSIPALSASSPQIVNEFIGFAVAAPDGKSAEETAGQMVLDLSERDLHLNGSIAEMSGETVPAALAAWGWTLSDDPEGRRHWQPRARGVSTDGERGYRFCGRTAALQAIKGWLDRDRLDPRVLLVTGKPGSGKSAVLGRIVTTADANAVKMLPAADTAVRASPGSVACAVHAKSKTALEVAKEIARAASAAIPERLEDFAPALRDALDRRGGRRFNVIIDALDEATDPDQARLIITKVILPLAEALSDAGAQVIAGSRRRDDAGDLLAVFDASPEDVVDLDSPRFFAEADLAAYAKATLQLARSEGAENPYADDDAAGPVADRIAELSDGNFLIAGLTARTHGLRDKSAVNPGTLSFTPTVDAAMREYLRLVPAVAGVPAETLLTALAFAEAPGLPAGLWQAALRALGAGDVPAAELTWFARSSAANFLVESSGPDIESAAFLLFHQALNDALLRARVDRFAVADDERELTRAFLRVGRDAGWDHAPPYLLESLSHHAERAGMLDELLTDDAYLLHANLRRLTPEATPDMTEPAKQRVRLLRLTPYAAATKDPRERRALFSVTEALERLGRSFRDDPGSAPYRARWSAVSTHTERAAQEGHTGGVLDLCSLVLDGRTLLVSGGEDEMARIWDPATGRQLHVLEGHAGQVIGVHGFTAEDGRMLLASAGTDGTARIWDPATGRQLHVLEGHVGTVMAVHGFTAGDGRTLLASAGADAVVGIWDPATGEQLHTLKGRAGAVHAVCSFPSGGRTLLASACEDSRILVWDPVSGEPRKTLERLAGDEKTEAVRWVCAFTPVGGRTLLASASAGTVWVWDPESGQYQELDGTTGAGGAWEICAFTADDGRPLLATAGSDEMVRVWDPATGRQLRELEAHHDEAYSVCAFTAEDGHTLLASGGDEPTVRVWDPATGEQRGAMKGPAGSPWSVCAFPGGDGQMLLATAGDEETVRVWDLATGEQRQALAGAAGGAWSVCAFPAGDGRMLLAGGGDEVRIWDPATRQLPRAPKGGTGRVISVCALVSEGRALLASGGADTRVRIWDPAAGKLLRTLEGHTGKIWDMCALVTADGKAWLASADNNGTVLVWDPSTGKQQYALDAVSGEVWAVCAFPAEDEQALLALAEGDGNIQVYDLATGKPHRTLRGHTAGVESVCAFTSGGRTLLASCASDDTEMRIWAPVTGRMLQVIPVHLTPKTVAAVDDILVLVLSAGLLTIKLNLEGSSGA